MIMCNENFNLIFQGLRPKKCVGEQCGKIFLGFLYGE